MDSKKNNILIVVVAVLAIVFVGFSIMRLNNDRRSGDASSIANRWGEDKGGQSGEQAKSDMPAKGNGMQAVVPAELTADQLVQLKAGVADHKAAELTFNITGGSFYYTPNEIKVKQGDKVKFVFTNSGGMHNLILEAYNVKTKDLKTGESETIEFTASKKGTFEFYCSIGNGYHRQKGQIGVLLVE
ncbi:MAG: cupredoxin domain-containing protein [Candidatus Falkowbacteria bacterium]|nr:cupredoxin domain-containing protein [Candidatus Falkowbacteria bacterium]